MRPILSRILVIRDDLVLVEYIDCEMQESGPRQLGEAERRSNHVTFQLKVLKIDRTYSNI